MLFLLDLYGSKDKLSLVYVRGHDCPGMQVLSFCKAMELFWLTTTHFSDNLHNKYKEEL